MIKNLLFDLGGVIMDIRRQRCVEAFQRLGMTRTADLLGDDYVQVGDFLRMESGEISPDEFRTIVRGMIPRDITDEQIDNALNQFLIGIPPHRLMALRQLRRKYRLFLLSNTNPIMWHSKIAAEFRQEGLEINDYFDGITTSFEAKSAKPDERIFRLAAERGGFTPHETLFIDDSKANLDAARRIGFHTLWVAQDNEFSSLIADFEQHPSTT